MDVADNFLIGPQPTWLIVCVAGARVRSVADIPMVQWVIAPTPIVAPTQTLFFHALQCA